MFWGWGIGGCGGRVVGEALEDGFGFFAACTGTVEAKFWGDLHDGLVAYNVPFWELADDTGDVFFFHSPGLELYAKFFGCFCMLADEHDATGQSVESVTRERIPLVAAFCAHDFDDGVVIVAAGRVNRDAGGLVDDDYVVVFVDDADRLCSYRGFMPVESVGDYIAVVDNGLEGRDWLAVEDYFTALYGVFLDCISRVMYCD